MRRNPTDEDSAPLFVRQGRTYVRVLRKQEALERLQAAGLSASQASYQLLTGARAGTIFSTTAHANAWLYAEADVDDLAQQLRGDAGSDQA